MKTKYMILFGVLFLLLFTINASGLEIGALYLQLTGGTITGNLNLSNNKQINLSIENTKTGQDSSSGVLSFTGNDLTVPQWADINCQLRRNIQFNNTFSAETFTRFNGIAKFNLSNIDYDLTSVSDARFYDMNDKLIEHYWQSYNNSGESIVQLNITQIGALNDTDKVTLYYDCSDTINTNRLQVYDNDVFLRWHLDINNTDSTGNGRAAAGFISGCSNKEGINNGGYDILKDKCDTSSIIYNPVSSEQILFNQSRNMTVMFWDKKPQTAASGVNENLFAVNIGNGLAGNGYFKINAHVSLPNWYITCYNGSVANNPHNFITGSYYGNNTWRHNAIVLEWNSTSEVLSYEYYRDAKKFSDSTCTTVTMPNFDVISIEIGAHNGGGGWNGSIDEVTVLNKSVSGDFVNATFQSQRGTYQIFDLEDTQNGTNSLITTKFGLVINSVNDYRYRMINHTGSEVYNISNEGVINTRKIKVSSIQGGADACIVKWNINTSELYC